MTNTEIDLYKIDRELAVLHGVYYSENEGEVFAEIDGSIDPFYPTTDPTQFMKLMVEYGLDISVNDDDENGKPTEWKAAAYAGEEGYGATPMIAGCLALIKALEEK